MRRRITTFIILLAVTSTSLSEAKAEIITFPCIGGTYSVEMPSAVLTKASGCTGELAIDKSVTKIGDRAFSFSEITSVSIPDSVNSIGDAAFSNSKLSAVIIPNSVKVIGIYAFDSSRNLRSVVMSNQVQVIKQGTFSWTGLTTFSFPSSINTIEILAFFGNQMTSIDVPDTVKIISNSAFPDTIKSITYCGPAIFTRPTAPTCPPERKAVIDAAAKAAADKAAAEKAAAEAKAAADRAAAEAKAAADRAAAEAKAAADRAAAEAKAAADRAATQAAQDAKKLTITCVKGKVEKKVTGETPKCPSGYKNPLDVYLTFKAFSNCTLYKKNSFLGGVTLADRGKTLTFSAVGKYPSVASAGNYTDLLCALGVLKVPSFVQTQIDTTRALDGLQKATWGKISAFWTYHPENGMNISFNSK